MRRLIYIFSFLALVLSCTDDITNISPDNISGDKVKVDFSVNIPEAIVASKAMGENPSLSNLKLAVFDNAGFLVEYVTANATEATANSTEYNYSAELTISETPRIIHFIGNGPENIKFGSEEEVMTALTTQLTDTYNDAYWQRRTVATITKNDDGTPTAETKAALTDIPLIRNFAKIVVTSEDADFELTSYKVVNTPKVGTVAPYNRNTGLFQDYGPESTFANLTSANYDAFVPVGAELNSDVTAEGFSSNPCYVYERETPISNPPFILVYGTYGNESVYYKVDLRDSDGDYIPLLRNLQYNVKITSVTRGGYETPAEAAQSAGSGDISTSIETANLTNISDGEVKLTVSYVDTVLVTNSPVTLDYKFESVGTNVTLNGDRVTIIQNNDYTDAGAVFSNVTDPSGNEGTITITPTDLANVAKTQTLTVLGSYTIGGVNKTIQRRVRYTLMNKLEMSAVCVPSEIPNVQGSAFDLMITIPAGLGSAMFPLEFTIEAEQLSITPDNDNMPVKTGVSTIPGKTNSAFYYIKSLSWEEYEKITNVDGFKTISCHFKSNMAKSATKIYVSNIYFNQTNTPLGNYTPRYFTNLGYSVNTVAVGTGNEVDFSFTMSHLPTQGDVIVTMENLIAQEDATNLTFISINNGVAKYEFNPNGNTGPHTLNLETAGSFAGELKVTLDAHHFIQNSLTAGRDWYYFSNVALGPIESGTDKEVTFTFSYDPDAIGVPVNMTLGGLVPVTESGNGWTLTGSEGKYIYETTDKTTQNRTITFKTTSDSSVSVELDAEDSGYKTESVSKGRGYTLIITEEKNTTKGLNLGLVWTRDVTIYSDNSYSNASVIGTVNFNAAGATRGYTFEVENLSPTDMLYLRYTTGFGTTHTAQIKGQDLMNGNDITFN